MDLHDEDGLALISVMGIMVVVLLLSGVAFQVAITSHRQSYDFAEYNAALAIADAGLDDYMARLNRIPNYHTIYTEAAPGDNAALDGWATITGSDGIYHIDVDASEVTRTGAVTVSSTGRVGEVDRTVETVFRPAGFLDFIYFTEFEIVDPAVTGADPADCSLYHYVGRDDEDCGGLIRFVTGDTIRGPMHTNDAMMIDGDPLFEGEATTSYPGPDGVADPDDCTTGADPLWRNQRGTSNPTFANDLCYDPIYPVPADNQSIQDQTTHTTTATQGCAYYGPTYVEFYDPDPGVENDGRMRVRSPYSTGHPAGTIATNVAHCGSAAELASSSGADRPIPPNGVVYVDDRTWGGCPSGHPLRLPRPGHVGAGYACDDGDAFVWGTVDGQVTVATANDINIVWDILYAAPIPDTDDLVGLVANNFVQIYHPTNSANQNLNVYGSIAGVNIPPFITNPGPGSATWQDPMINAAMMAMRHSFQVSSFHRGQPFTSGELSVRGAIAQYFRGPVGQSYSNGTKAHGYDKDYVYDDRLQYLSPPFFVQPGGDTAWEPKSWAELPPPADLPG